MGTTVAAKNLDMIQTLGLKKGLRVRIAEMSGDYVITGFDNRNCVFVMNSSGYAVAGTFAPSQMKKAE